MPEFNFSTKVTEADWLIEDLIPMGHLNVVLAQAGVGKSLLVESIAVHMVHDMPFCGFKTVGGDVLIVDQDTPQNVLQKRILQFSKEFSGERKYKLFVESMGNYSLHNNTLTTIIKDHPTARLVIIDCLGTVCGQLNPNTTSDMTRLAKLKSACLKPNNTILLNHHISQKQVYSADDLMQGETGHLAMGNSAIIQQADSYYIVGATAEKGKTDKIYVRPVSKRLSIPTAPIMLRVLNNSVGGETISYNGYYEPELADTEQDVLTLFREQRLERTVKEVYEGMGHQHGEITVRKSLAKLEKIGKLRLSRNRSNLFKYRLP